MTTVIGVSFKRAGKMYYFDPNGLETRWWWRPRAAWSAETW